MRRRGAEDSYENIDQPFLRFLEIPWFGSLVVDDLSYVLYANKTLLDLLEVEEGDLDGEYAPNVLGCDSEQWSNLIEEGAGSIILKTPTGRFEVGLVTFPCGDDKGRCCILDIGSLSLTHIGQGEEVLRRMGIGRVGWNTLNHEVVIDDIIVNHPGIGEARISLDTAEGRFSLEDGLGLPITLNDKDSGDLIGLFTNIATPHIIEGLSKVTGGFSSQLNEFFRTEYKDIEMWFEVALTPPDEEGWSEGLIRQMPTAIIEGLKARIDISAFERVLDLVPLSVCVIRDEDIIYANQAMAELTGKEKEELIGQCFFDLVHPDERGIVNHAYRSRINGRDAPSHYTLRMMGKDGDHFHLHVRAKAIDWQGSPVSLVIGEDVTEYISTEERLQNDEMQKRLILDSVPNPIILSSPEGMLMWSNRAARDALFIGEDDLECDDLLAPDEDLDTKNFWSDVRTEGMKVLEQVRLRDGRFYRVAGVPMIDKGVFSGIVHDMYDITSKVEAEQRAEVAKQSLDIASYALGFSTFHYDHGSDRILLYNIPREFIVPDDDGLIEIGALGKVIHPDDLDSVLDIFVPGLVKAGMRTERIFRARLTSASYRWYRLLASLIENEEGDRVSGALFDIHELRSSQLSLAEANRKLGLLSGITGHDILNQVTVLMGYGELLTDKLISDGRTDYTGLLDKMMVSVKNIQEQVEFARDYQEMGINEPRWMDVSKKVEELKAHPSFRQVKVVNDVEDMMIFADPLLKRVLFNLFENSLRHGGEVSTIRVHSPKAGVLVVEDDGVGIPHASKERVFDREVGSNTGLGLFLAKEVLSMTGIAIREDGEPGTGARFVIEAPADRFMDKGLQDRLAI